MAKKNTENTIVLTKEQLKAITETASLVAIEKYRKEEDRAAAEKRDKRLYNTRLLMEKYRGMVKYSESAVYDASQVEDNYDFISLMDMMRDGSDNYTLTVHSIQERAATVAIIIYHINRMLEFYECRCKRSGKGEIMRKYEVIKKLYLDEDEMTVQDIADEMFVDVSTVYKYNRAAMQDLSALFFGYID